MAVWRTKALGLFGQRAAGATPSGGLNASVPCGHAQDETDGQGNGTRAVQEGDLHLLDRTRLDQRNLLPVGDPLRQGLHDAGMQDGDMALGPRLMPGLWLGGVGIRHRCKGIRHWHKQFGEGGPSGNGCKDGAVCIAMWREPCSQRQKQQTAVSSTVSVVEARPHCALGYECVTPPLGARWPCSPGHPLGT